MRLSHTKTWPLLAGQLMQERTELHKVGVDTVALHPSQALVATGGADRLIKLWPCHSQVLRGSTSILLVQRMQNLQKRLSDTSRLSYMQLDSFVPLSSCTCMEARRVGVTFRLSCAAVSSGSCMLYTCHVSATVPAMAEGKPGYVGIVMPVNKARASSTDTHLTRHATWTCCTASCEGHKPSTHGVTRIHMPCLDSHVIHFLHSMS